MKRIHVVAFGFHLAVLAGAGSGQAQSVLFTNRFRVNNEGFGDAVAMVGNDKVVVGAWGEELGGSTAGRVYLFNLQGQYVSTITNPTPSANDLFGIAVAPAGLDRFLVAAYLDDTGGTNAGAAYLFHTNGTLLATFTNLSAANDPEDNAYTSQLSSGGAFAQRVAMVGDDKVVLGNPLNNTGAINAGDVQLFSINGTRILTFANPAPQAGDQFGFAVAAVGSRHVLIGANYGGSNRTGVAYLFATNGALVTRFNSSNAAPAFFAENFGASVAAVGTDKVLIGAYGAYAPYRSSGVAYLYDTNGALRATFRNPTPAPEDRFGYRLSAVGTNKVLIGAHLDDTAALEHGAAYLFDLSGALLTTLHSPRLAERKFGQLVLGVNSDQLFIGAESSEPGGSFGVVHLFFLRPTVLVNGQLLTTNSITVNNFTTVMLRSSFEDGKVYYSLDGSNPAVAPHVYTGPIVVSNSVTLRAFSVSANGRVSDEAVPLTILFAAPPEIVRQPESQVIAADGIASFSVKARGTTPLTYQWQLDGVLLAGATNPTLVRSNFSAGVHTVTVRVQDIFGSNLSSGATLRVLRSLTALGPPASIGTRTGLTEKLCVNGQFEPGTRFQWRRNGANILNATGPCLEFREVRLADGGSYTLVAANEVESRVLSPTTLTITNGLRQPADAFALRVPLEGANGLVSGNNINATNEGGEPPHAGQPPRRSVWYTWTAPTTGVARFRTTGSTFDTLLSVYTGTSLNKLKSVAEDDDLDGFRGSAVVFNATNNVRYHIAIDGFDGAQGSFVLSWTLLRSSLPVPDIRTNPLSQAVQLNGTAQFSVVAMGQPLKYQWLFNGKPISRATKSNFKITGVQPSDVGRYSVSVSMESQAVTSAPAVLEISSVVEAGPSTDKLEGLPAAPVGNTRSFSGASPGLSAELPAFPPVLGQLYSQIVVNSTNNSLSLSNCDGSTVDHCDAAEIQGTRFLTRLRITAERILFAHTTNDSGGRLISLWRGGGANGPWCLSLCSNGVIRAEVGGTNGIHYLLGIHNTDAPMNTQVDWAVAQPPILTAKSAAAARLGTDLELRAEAFNSHGSTTEPVSWIPEPSYRWFKQMRNPLDDAIQYEPLGQEQRTLFRPALQPSDAGVYRVEASNLAGSTTRDVAVTVGSPPSEIILVPASAQVAAGSTLQIAANVVSGVAFGPGGGQPVAHDYHWSFKSVPQPGQSGEVFVRPKMLLSDNGDCCVLVSNLYGGVVQCANVTVRKASVLSLSGLAAGQAFINPVVIPLTVRATPADPDQKNLSLRIFDDDRLLFSKSAEFSSGTPSLSFNYDWVDPSPGSHRVWASFGTPESEQARTVDYPVRVYANSFGFAGMSGLQLQPNHPTAEDDIRFGCTVVITNSTAGASQPLRVRLQVVPSYYVVPTEELPPPEFEPYFLNWGPAAASLTGFTGRGWLEVPVNLDLTDPQVFCPRSRVTGLAVYRFHVYAILEERLGEGWLMVDRMQLLSGPIPDVSMLPQTVERYPAPLPSPITVTNLTVSGPTHTFNRGTAAFHALATFDNGQQEIVFPEWSTRLPHHITAVGVFTAGSVPEDTSVWITATYRRANAVIAASNTIDILTRPFSAQKGTYTGLFYDTNGIEHGSSGFFSLNLTDRGTYTAKLRHDNRKLSTSGTFSNAGAATNTDIAGTATNIVPRKGTNELTVIWQLGVLEAEQVEGTVSDGEWSATLLGDRAVFDPVKRPCTYAGKYTFAVLGFAGHTNAPEGHGYGTMVVRSNGIVTVTGYLADQTKAVQKVPLSGAGKVPFYARLEKGSLLGWLNLIETATNDVSGNLNWHKLRTLGSHYYRDGFNRQTMLLGSRYHAPAGSTNPILPLTHSHAVFSGGNLSLVVTNDFDFGPANTIVNHSPHQFSLTLKSRTGMFKGILTLNGSTEALPFNGVVLQKTTNGLGYFLATNQSGSVRIESRPFPP